MKKNKLLLIGILASFIQINCYHAIAQNLYTQTGTDPTWDFIIKNNLIPIGVNSTNGIKGSTINVNNALVENVTYGNNKIPQDINIHTLGNSVIPRTSFPKWTRWYQEDGNTQVFRLFKGEYNVRNDRPNAARTEAFSKFSFKKGDGWQEWVATYTIVKPLGAAIFQSKNNEFDWSVQINCSDNGDIILNHRRGTDIVLAKNMTGKSFDIRVRDDGYNYEVFYNGNFIAKGFWERPTGGTSFRWGMYVGSSIPSKDALIFVTGATINPKTTPVKQSQTISFGTLSAKKIGGVDFSAGATASSGLVVSYSSSNLAVATIVNGKIHLVGVGTSTITASQAGNTAFNAAPNVSQTLTVNNIVVKQAQTISFGTLPTKKIGDADFSAGAIASSGLGVSYASSNTAVATIVNGKIHIVGAGTAVITASQVGNTAFNAAANVSQILTINKVVVGTDPIAGPSCGKSGQALSFTLNPANTINATSYSWWFTGASQSITPSGTSCIVMPNQYFTSGAVCVGVQLTGAPYYVQYCKAIGTCSARIGEDELINNSIQEALSIYPNPSAQGQSVVLDASNYNAIPSRVQIINSIGETVLENSNPYIQTTLSVATLNGGTYTVKVIFDGQTITKRLVIVK